ncbi:uncharacterized protein B0T15DRAFT_510041 [Chaetomium strumarium]|uniref:Uncharacterized protein n=1 Tax=Chaetomium strumarium TaxID=1170767 RepID=A0AAJ0GV92_9PEZI|nr:hypothetical protein B0T15DRAFT_510041 [Chaetomium strumarium]
MAFPTFPAPGLPHKQPPLPLPPSYLEPPSHLTASLPVQITSPHALRFPAAWRCGTCGAANAVLELMKASRAAVCECAMPSLQAVYDQFGDIYLYWRDDPAVADLRDPAMVQEARRRVWEAGGAWWEVVGVGFDFDSGVWGVPGDARSAGRGRGGEGDEGMETKKRLVRRWTGVSQSSAASDESEGSLDSGPRVREE